MVPSHFQFRAARGAVGWSVDELAAHAKLNRKTVLKLETEGDGTVTLEAALRAKRALESAGVVFFWPIPALGLGEGVLRSSPSSGFEPASKPSPEGTEAD